MLGARLFNAAIRARLEIASRLRQHAGGVVAVRAGGLQIAWRITADGLLQSESPLIDADAAAEFSFARNAAVAPSGSWRQELKKRLRLQGSADMLDAFGEAAKAVADDCATKCGFSQAPPQSAIAFVKQKVQFAEQEIGAYLRDECDLVAGRESIRQQGEEIKALRRRIDTARRRAEAL